MEPRFAAITAGILALIVYGSLYPFDFHDRGGIGEAIRYFFSTSAQAWDRGDVLSNILLYLPLGLFGARTLRIPAAARVPAIFALGSALSLTLEVTQFYDATRASQMSDWGANSTGTLIGALAETVLRPERFPRIRWRPFALVLLGSALGAWLFPFVPGLDAARYLRAVHAANQAVAFEPLAIYEQMLFWLVLAMLLESLAGVNFSRVATPGAALCVLAVRFAIPGAAVVRADLIGAVLGALLWSVFLWNLKPRAMLLAAMFAIFVAIDALRPFTFLPAPRNFEWIPFVSFINGARGYGSRVFLEKTFIYGALLWLLVQARWSWLQATLGALGLVIAVRFAQMWLPGRSAEITDAAMVLILAAVMKALPDAPVTTH